MVQKNQSPLSYREESIICICFRGHMISYTYLDKFVFIQNTDLLGPLMVRTDVIELL